MAQQNYCPECQAGVLRIDGATYYTWINDELIMVPDFPCWVCDFCGKRNWDSTAIMQLNILLSPNAGKIPGKSRVVLAPPKVDVETSVKKKAGRGRKLA